MRHLSRFIVRGLTIGALSTFVLGTTLYAFGARINTTRSIPVGLYWTDDAPVQKGSYVLFCPPRGSLFDEAKNRGYIAAGFCNGGYGFMMKRVLAAKGDTVSISADGVVVNGELLPHSRPLPADKAGRLLPQVTVSTRTLDDAELLLMSEVSDTSFDARYFGVINDSQIDSVIRPILTW